MFTLPRLTLRRQRRVAQSLDEADGNKTLGKSLHTEVRAALGKTTTAGQRLDASYEIPVFLLDNSTDVVFGAFHHVNEQIERGMDDRVIAPLPPDRARKKAAATTLLTRALPDDLGYLSDSMSLQYGQMRVIVDHLRKEPECIAAVRELHLEYFVDHMEAHLAPYGRAVTSADGRDMEAESDAFHAAFTALAVKVEAHHGGDAAVHKALLGAYETELEAQRTEEREARRRRRSSKKPA